MEIQPQLIASFLGSVLGAATAGFAFFYKKADQSRRELRLVIYELLGIYRAIDAAASLTPEKYLEACSDVLKSLGNEELPGDPNFNSFFMPLVTPQIELALADLTLWSEEDYRERIKKVAETAPLLAHRLKSNTLLTKAIPNMREYQKKFLASASKEGANTNEVLGFFPKLETHVADDLLVDLKNDVLKISRRVGFTEYFRMRAWFKAQDKKTLTETIEPLFRKILHENAQYTTESQPKNKM